MNDESKTMPSSTRKSEPLPWGPLHDASGGVRIRARGEGKQYRKLCGSVRCMYFRSALERNANRSKLFEAQGVAKTLTGT